MQSLNIYLKATQLDAKDDETKIAILLNLAGNEAQKKFQTFNINADDRKKFDKVVQSFKDYCKPLKNETYERYKFFTRVQQEGEDFDHFLTDVKVLAKECNFGQLEDSLVRDKIVSGISDLSLQEKLLQVSALSLRKAEVCRAAEVSRYQVKKLRNIKKWTSSDTIEEAKVR